MKKRLVSILLTLSMSAALAACGSSGESGSSAASASDEGGSTASGEASGDPIMIGTISPNTGSIAAAGTAVVNGTDLAVQQINDAGGVLGRQIVLDHADDQFDPTECLNAFNSLVSGGNRLIIGSVTSGCTSAITDAANEEETVLITPVSTADSITTEDDYIFRSCYADSYQGAIAAAYAKQSGHTSVGVVYCAADTYSKGLYDSFAEACERYGIGIAAVESTSSMDVQDYTNQFTAMVKAGVDLVYCPYYYDVIGPYLVTQARSAGYDGIIMGADGYDGTQDYVPDGADLTAFNGVYWTSHFDSTDSSPKVQEFVSAYKEAYGSDPVAYAALGYDCVLMLQNAIERAGTDEASAVRDALADTSIEYECVTGTFHLDETGTPQKGASIIAYTSDGGPITTELVDTVTSLPEE